MYESPIKVFCTNTEHWKLEDEAVFRAVRNLGFLIDQDELIRALRYDRDQYDKGYQDAMASVVKCEDCKHWANETDELGEPGGYCKNPDGLDNFARPDDFCSYGERKDNG